VDLDIKIYHNLILNIYLFWEWSIFWTSKKCKRIFAFNYWYI